MRTLAEPKNDPPKDEKPSADEQKNTIKGIIKEALTEYAAENAPKGRTGEGDKDAKKFGLGVFDGLFG